MDIDKKKALVLLPVVVAAAIIGGIALSAYSAANACSAVNGEDGWNGSAAWAENGWMVGTQGWPRGGMLGRGCFGFEVSDEFRDNVVNITKNDTDVLNLLNDGYNITGVRPIIKTAVEGDGSVVMKATGAIVMLEKNTTSHAIVKVDVENAKVTEIIILTKTVIEKP